MTDTPDAWTTTPKAWWTSRGTVGAVVTVAVGLAGLAGWSIDAAQTTELVLSLIALVSGVVGWWGNVQRKGPIDKHQVLPGLRLNRPVLPDAGGLRPTGVPPESGGPDSGPKNPFLDP